MKMFLKAVIVSNFLNLKKKAFFSIECISIFIHILLVLKNFPFNCGCPETVSSKCIVSLISCLALTRIASFPYPLFEEYLEIEVYCIDPAPSIRRSVIALVFILWIFQHCNNNSYDFDGASIFHVRSIFLL